MSAPIDIVAFSPHPDDAEIGCAGLLLLAAQQGLTTAIVDLSEGERSTRGTPDLRLREKDEAAKRLGLLRRISLGLPDTRIGREEAHEGALVTCLRELRPRLVLAPHHADRHPDHVEAARLIDRAVFFAGVGAVHTGEPHRVERVLHYAIHQPVVPNLIFDVTGVWSQCQHVLAAYQSQFFDTEPGVATALSDGGFRSAMEARSRHYGAMIHAAHGEPYLSPAPLFIESPRSLLRKDAGLAYGSFR